jgi:hypothetical protein
MNIKCEGCKEPTIGLKWLYWFVFIPFLKLFMQVSCKRCKTEQEFRIFKDSMIISYIDMGFSTVIIIGLIIWATISGINISSKASINFWLDFMPWTILILFIFFRLSIKFIYLFISGRISN